MSKKPETIFKERALEKLRAIPGSYWIKIQQKSIRGTPDVFGCYHGLMVAIELKTDVGVTDPLQEYELKRWGRAGAMTLVSSPSSLEKDLETIMAIPDNKGS